MKKFKFRALTAIALMSVICMNGVAQITFDIAKLRIPTSIIISSQSGIPNAGMEGTAIFTLIANIPNWDVVGSVQWYLDAQGQKQGGRPSGVETEVSLSRSGSSLIVTTDGGTQGGTYYFRVVAGNVQSNVGILIVTPPGKASISLRVQPAFVITPLTPIVISAGESTPLTYRYDLMKSVLTVSWSTLNPDIATINSSGEVTGQSNGTATILATIYERNTITGMCTKTVTVEGVLINGVVWATSNVNTFRTFASSPESPGMFYQWNRATAYPVTGPVTWNSTPPSGVWDNANDPVPNGWRLPTKEDFEKLLSNSVSFTWTTVNGREGGRFTNLATGKSIFLPAVGRRVDTNGALEGANGYGAYWTSTKHENGVHAYYLYMDNVSKTVNPNDPFAFGYSIRPVKK